MHLVPAPIPRSTQAERLDALVGLPLTVVFAEDASIAAVRDQRAVRLDLVPPYHASGEDAYLVLPDDIGNEITDILADGDRELLGEALRDGLIVLGSLERDADERRAGTRAVYLGVEGAIVPEEALRDGLPYADVVPLVDAETTLEALNALDHVQLTVCASFLDAEGLGRVLGEAEHVGALWTPDHGGQGAAGVGDASVQPCLGWSRHLGDGRVGIELALFGEYEELVAVLRPAMLVPLR
jgi:hypothetical protein